MFQLIKFVAILPFAVMISGGGLLSICDFFGMLGLHPHHHGESSAETICLHECDHHTEADHDIPCSDDCLIELPAAEAFIAVQMVKPLQPALLPTEIATFGTPNIRNALRTPIIEGRPPGWRAELASPMKTGRFLL